MERQPRWALEFLRHLVLTGDARRAAGRARVDIATLFEWRERSWDFTGLWQAALSLRGEFLEQIEVGGEAWALPEGVGTAPLPAPLRGVALSPDGGEGR